MPPYRSGPSPVLVVVIAAFLVFGGYFVWTGLLNFFEAQGDINHNITQVARSTETAEARPTATRPYFPVTFTPLPPCQTFVVDVESAVYRECPSKDNTKCPVRDTVPYGTELCVYARAPENPEWYVVELNPGGAYRDIVYIHESVVEAANPTPTPSLTFTPAPTVSPAPSSTPTAPSEPANPTASPGAVPTPTGHLPQVTI